jgi:hypothetical protein
MMQQSVWSSTPPDRYHEGIGDELGRHLGFIDQPKTLREKRSITAVT